MNKARTVKINTGSQWLKPPRREQRCGNCNAFLANKQANPRAGEARQGWCRATPPVAMPVMLPPNALQAQPQMGMQGAVPPTNDQGWCRAWESDDDESPVQ